MAGKKQTATLETLIPEYGQAKQLADDYKKSAEKLNTKIKEIMRELPKDKWKNYSVDNWTASYRVDETVSMNEEQLIELLKSNGLAKGIVRRKEYIDEKALENAIYNNLIPKKVVVEMDKCKTVKSKQVLTIKQKEAD